MIFVVTFGKGEEEEGGRISQIKLEEITLKKNQDYSLYRSFEEKGISLNLSVCNGNQIFRSTSYQIWNVFNYGSFKERK